MRRFLKFAIVALVLLVLIAIAVTQAVLWSDYPRRLVERQLAETIGLRVEIGELATGWWGRSELRDVRVFLPLSDVPMVVAPVVRADHTGLLWLALTRDFDLAGLEADAPVLDVRERADGSWDVQDAFDIVRARLDRPGDGGDKPAALPDVAVIDAVINVRLAGRDQPLVLADVQASAESPTRLDYAWRLEAPALGRAEGNLAPQAPWPHAVRVALQPDPAWLAAAMGDELPAVGVTAEWRGTWDEGQLRGRLDVQRAAVGANHMAGAFEARLEPGTQRLFLRPEGLRIHIEGLSEPVAVHRGEVSYTLGRTLSLMEVAASAFGADATLNGDVDQQTRAGRLQVAWQSRSRAVAEHHGRATIAIDRTEVGRRVHATVDAEAKAPWGELTSRLDARVEGPRWREMAGIVTAERLQLRRDESVFHLDGLTADVARSGELLQLRGLRLPESATPRRLAAQGQYNLAEHAWDLDLVAVAFVLPGLPPFGTVPLDRLTVEASGNPGALTLQSAAFRGGGVELEATGGYAFDTPQPLTLDVTVKQAPIRFGGDEREASARRLGADNLFGRLRVRGLLSPLTLEGEGDLTARALRLVSGDRVDRWGDIVTHVEGRLDPQRAELRAVAPQWLGGRWRFDAGLDRAAGEGQVRLLGEDLDLKLVQAAISAPVAVEGLGQVDVTIDVPQADLRGFTAHGSFALRDVAVAVPGSRIVAEQVRGDVQVDHERVRLTGLRASRGAATVTGEATGSLRGGPVRVRAAADAWPVSLAGGDVELTLDGTADVTADGEATVGEADLRSRIRVMNEEVGSVAVQATASPQRLELRSLEGAVLGGSLHGEGVVDLEQLVGSDLTVRWHGIRPGELARWWPTAAMIEGDVAGTLIVRHTTDPRALAPLKLTMNLDAGGAGVRGLTFGDGVAEAYTDGTRFVLERFDLGAAGGTVSLWGRLSEQAGKRYLFANAAAERLDMSLLDRALVGENDKPVVGRLDAEMTVSAPLDDWRLAYGAGRIQVSESDLVNVPIFGGLYRLVNLQIGRVEPQGRGAGEVRIEEGHVVFPGFRYQNRGAQFHVALRIADVWQGKASPITGYATASQKLLPEVTFFGGVSEAISLLQEDLTPHRITGTLGEPVLQAQPLKSLGAAFGEIVGAPRTSSEAEPSPSVESR